MGRSRVSTDDRQRESGSVVAGRSGQKRRAARRFVPRREPLQFLTIRGLISLPKIPCTGNEESLALKIVPIIVISYLFTPRL